ncbi:Exportin-1/Importin-beta-like [Trinorchestia longiramus]|nr:Exportin-1/Importin-beta-like [Trinorchestia longiramus]
MEIELNEVFAAIDTLYCEQTTAGSDVQRENLQKASDWLGNLQKSVQSWKIADQLLHMKRDIRSCFFASQTLRTKIQFYFGELPPESHESFRNSMLDHLSHITDEAHQGITTQLCVAVADLALLMSSWKDPFGDLWTEFGAFGRRKNLVPLLEVLIALPEELNSRQLRLGQKRREQMEAYCKAQVPRLIELLVTVVSSGSLAESQEIRVLRCLSSWFNLHCAEWLLLVKTGLMGFVLGIVSNPRTPARSLQTALMSNLCYLLFFISNLCYLL